MQMFTGEPQLCCSYVKYVVQAGCKQVKHQLKAYKQHGEALKCLLSL